MSVLVLGWLCALAPEVGPDALGGRQAIVNLWIRDGGFQEYRELTLSYMMMGGESYYLMLFPFAGQSAAKVGQLTAVIALLPLVIAVVRPRNFTSNAIVLAVALSGLVFVQLSWGFVDLLQSLYYVSAIAALRYWEATGSRNILFWAGALAGAATAVKLNGGGAAVLLGLGLIAIGITRRESIRAIVGNATAMAAGFAIVVGPWAIRSFILSGNPFFPYANAIFKSPMAPAELIAKRFGDAANWKALLELPWRLFMEPFHYAEIGGYHPLLLVALPLVVMAAFHRKSRYWTWMGIGAATLWIVTEQNARYSLFAALLLSLGVASFLQVTMPRARCIRVVTSIAAALGLVAGVYAQLLRPSAWLFRQSDGATSPLSIITGRESRQEYLLRSLPHTSLLQHVDQSHGKNGVVWEFPWLRDHLHLQGTAIAMPHCDHRLGIRLRALLDHPAAGADVTWLHWELTDLGITHLITNPDSVWAPQSHQRPYSALFGDEFQRRATRIEAACGNFVLLSVRPTLLKVGDATPDKVTENRIKDPALDMASGNWSPAGALVPRANGRAILPQGATLHQAVPVSEGDLYEIEVQFDISEPHAGGLLHTGWRNADGKLLRYHVFPVESRRENGRARFWQTAPLGATVVDLTLSGPVIPLHVSLRDVRHDGNMQSVSPCEQ